MNERKNSWKFFQNKECAFYPCHDLKELNCKFCYCPLYHLKDCGGDFEMIDGGDAPVKDCSKCTFPHKFENHDKLIDKLTKSLKVDRVHEEDFGINKLEDK